MTVPARRWILAGLLAAVALAGCTGPAPAPSGTATTLAGTPGSPPAAAASPGPAGPPSSAGPPAFVGTAAPVTAADLPYTWHSGCPVGPAQLRLLRLSYWGFDGAAHLGTMVVSAAVSTDVITVFDTLYRQRFPIRQMQPEDAYRGRDPDSMAADNTSGFNCRAAVAAGAAHWSAHAYGEAVDVNTVENPYLEGGTVMPPAGSAYLDRSRYRPGMAVPDGVLVRAFAAVGWQWGGRWSGSPDYQHFSRTGG